MLVTVGASFGTDSRAQADDFRSSTQLRPVPKHPGSQVQNRQPAANVASAALQWRSSGQVTPTAPQPVQAAAAAHAEGSFTQRGSAVERSGGVVAEAPVHQAPVRQAQFELPNNLAPANGDQPLPDFFAEPFAELPEPAQLPADEPEVVQPQLGMPQVAPSREQSNGLREHLQAPQPVPMSPALNDSDTLDLPPVPRGVGSERAGSDRPDDDEYQMPRSQPDRRPSVVIGDQEDPSLVNPVAYSCDDFRASIATATIQKVSLDISPPFRPDVISYDDYVKRKQRFEETQEVRDWQSIDGRKLGRGRLRNLAYEKVIIETEFGTTEELPVGRISEADLAYISSHWGLPKECLIDQPQYQPRRWQPSKVTWKASNLVHNPLYFEDVNLERYGHTRGPLLQPVVSSAHFFANIAVMPYKMGVHLPNECQYALGYYRPGDCAPWIKQPIPISLRGALFQAGAVGATVALIP